MGRRNPDRQLITAHHGRKDKRSLEPGIFPATTCYLLLNQNIPDNLKFKAKSQPMLTLFYVLLARLSTWSGSGNMSIPPLEGNKLINRQAEWRATSFTVAKRCCELARSEVRGWPHTIWQARFHKPEALGMDNS